MAQATNPETYISPSAPPFFIQHGDHDETVPHQQSINLAAKLTAVLGPENVSLELLKGARHAGPEFETEENIKKVLDFLEKHLK